MINILMETELKLISLPNAYVKYYYHRVVKENGTPMYHAYCSTVMYNIQSLTNLLYNFSPHSVTLCKLPFNLACSL